MEENNHQEKKKKPVSFPSGRRSFYRENTYAQNLLIKAISRGITDPQELKQAAGMHTVAEVYRSLDRLAIRKEYHNALVRAGLDLDYMVNELKDLTNSDSDKIRLGAVLALLKSLGLDKYEPGEGGANSWEDEINRIADKKLEAGEDILEGEAVVVPAASKVRYEVIAPPVPAAEKKKQNLERKLGRELYAD